MWIIRLDLIEINEIRRNGPTQLTKHAFFASFSWEYLTRKSFYNLFSKLRNSSQMRPKTSYEVFLQQQRFNGLYCQESSCQSWLRETRVSVILQPSLSTGPQRLTPICPFYYVSCHRYESALLVT
jgi:hypothetical protein